ncbi:hypothetical protein MJK71_27090 [Escherichia coli]|nr:hypothetical protein MJK71_27090 [Escherichia coli]
MLRNQANRLRESGKEAEAEAMLRSATGNLPRCAIDLTLADWAQQRRTTPPACACRLSECPDVGRPSNADAILGLDGSGYCCFATKRRHVAQVMQLKLPSYRQRLAEHTAARGAGTGWQLYDTAAAQRTFTGLIPQAKISATVDGKRDGAA